MVISFILGKWKGCLAKNDDSFFVAECQEQIVDILYHFTRCRLFSIYYKYIDP